MLRTYDTCWSPSKTPPVNLVHSHVRHVPMHVKYCVYVPHVLFGGFSAGGGSLQMTLEDGFERFARACGQPSILLCDRGLMDGSVYMPPEEWACLVSRLFISCAADAFVVLA